MKRKTHERDGIFSEAIYSDCEKYRYVLSRTWDAKKGRVLFIGLNPSTATEMKNDPTVTRMVNYAKNWGFGGLVVCNAFAFRATFPEDLKKCAEPIGKENDKHILAESRKAAMVVAAWGNHADFLDRGKSLRKLLGKFYYLGFTKTGEPKHPLYLRNDLKPVISSN